MAKFSLLRDFPRTFWIANVMELFERGAYYGLQAVLAVYLKGDPATGGLGFGTQAVGFLQSIMFAATYIVPILGGALADRYGYRRMLLLAFSLLAAGYFGAGFTSTYGLVFLALLVMATGSGLFKPIISGTIARTTNEKTSAFGFGVYYWMINLGAFVAPLIVSWLKGISWQLVFTTSALYCAAMLAPAVFLYRDPPRPESRKSVGEVLSNAMTVLTDSRFMLMVVIYSGFWILYYQNFGTVLWYLEQFIDRGPVDVLMNRLLGPLGITFKFDAEHVTVINAGTIILLQVLISRIVKDLPALGTMITGMAIGGLGFLILASSLSPWVFILGIAVFSIGEMTAHPKYYSFVGLVAPAEHKAVYMGYSFLYGVFGSLLGFNIGSFLYEKMLKPFQGTLEAPEKARIFWLMFAVLDAFAALGLFLFSKAFGKDTPETRAKARVAMFAAYSLIFLLGAAFLVYGIIWEKPFNPKTIVQASIFLVLGGLGNFMNLRKRSR